MDSNTNTPKNQHATATSPSLPNHKLSSITEIDDQTNKIKTDGNDGKKSETKYADMLVNLAINQGCELFHNRHRDAYVTIKVDEHTETWKLRSRGFKHWLQTIWYKTCRKGVASTVITEALDTLDAKAVVEGSEYEVFLRVAHVNGEIYVDLCNTKWQAICITKDGWSIVDEPPVKFIRTKGMLPLPMPMEGGNPCKKLHKLRTVINAAPDKTWCLIVAWILGAFSEGPFTVLVLTGEQGSAKSFLCKVLRQLDPSRVPVTTAPKEARDVIIAAQNSYVVALDNLSRIELWLNDLLCGIATGTAYRERKYHTNDGEEVLFEAKLPIVLNGIDLSMKDDLLSRSLLAALPMIPDDQRQDEKEISAKLQAASPEILGGIFDVLSAIMKRLPKTKLVRKPRMADFALWITAAEKVMGWEPGYFMQVYMGNREDAVELALESSPFGSSLRNFMQCRTEWEGGWEELSKHLQGDHPQRGWPATGKSVANQLKRLAPALRHFGIQYEHKSDGGKRFIRIWKQTSNASEVSAANTDLNFFPDTSDGYDTSIFASSTPRKNITI